MATDILPLPSADILDDEIAAAPRQPLLRRLLDAMIEAQTRRAQREIVRVLGSRAPDFTTKIPPQA